MLCEPVSQVAFCLANVQGRTKRSRDAIDDISRVVAERVCDIMRTVMGSCEDDVVRDVETISTVRAGSRERPHGTQGKGPGGRADGEID